MTLKRDILCCVVSHSIIYFFVFRSLRWHCLGFVRSVVHASFMALAFSLLNNLGVGNWIQLDFLGCSRGHTPGQAKAVFLNFSCLEASHRACSIPKLASLGKIVFYLFVTLYIFSVLTKIVLLYIRVIVATMDGMPMHNCPFRTIATGNSHQCHVA